MFSRFVSFSARSRAASSVCTLLALVGVAGVAGADNRTFDGSGNNIANPAWGEAEENLLRLSPVGYADGVSTMARPGVTGPREISNAVADQSGSIPNARNMSDWVWQWGQFIDHDLDLTPGGGAEIANISTPPGDPWFLGTPIGFSRSVFDAATGTGVGDPRQQPNEITAYIDGSNVYGSSLARANALRSGAGGTMLTSAGNLLPFNTLGLSNDNGPAGGADADFFAAGDVRANEQAGLTATHTLWMREHNHWADRIANETSIAGDEDIFQAARKIVIAEMQAITYNEWIPALIGKELSPYSGYDDTVNAGVSTEFSTAAFRFGHTMLSADLLRLDDNGAVIGDGNLSLRDAFFNAANITDVGIEPYLKGLASQKAQEIDNLVIDDVRNFLFGPPGAGGFDLASLNIQRGRDHGLSDYNTLRVAMGLAAKNDFSEISSDPSVQAALASVYSNVDEIDPWVGLLAEDHVAGGSLGELARAVFVDQFERTRDGDRFFYKAAGEMGDLSSILTELGLDFDALDGVRLSDVILRTSDLTNIQGNVFFIPTPASAALLAGAGLFLTRRRRA